MLGLDVSPPLRIAWRVAEGRGLKTDMTARRAGYIGLFVVISLVEALFVVPVSAQAPARHLTVEPATGLENQVVHVTWTGFHPTVDGANTVTLYQCKGVRPTSLSDCYTDFAPPVTEFGTATDQATTGSDGTGSDDLEVRPGLQLPQLGCSTRSPCSILAYENDGSDLPAHGLPSTAVSARLDFALSPSDCPRVATPDVTTAGEGSASHALYSWSARVCSGAKPLALDYTESSSPEGRDNFLKGLTDVGLTSTAPTADEIAAGTKRKFTTAPIDLTGVVVAFNVSDTVTHERITDMNLTPRLVAIMIAGGQFGGPGQSVFSDPEFLANNPGHHWPSRVEPPLMRSERNADAYFLTGWLNADRAARAFLDGKDSVAAVDPFWKNIKYPTDSFEARDPNTLGSYNPRSGTLTNARRLFNFQAPGDAVISPLSEGLLGIMDAVTAAKFGFATAKLRPANAAPGAGFVAADSAGLLAGYHAMKSVPGAATKSVADDATKVPDPTAAGAYPLVKIDYALVPTSGATKAKADNIARFLDYAGNGGQVAGVLSPGYVPMPTDLRAQTAAAQRWWCKAEASQRPTRRHRRHLQRLVSRRHSPPAAGASALACRSTVARPGRSSTAPAHCSAATLWAPARAARAWAPTSAQDPSTAPGHHRRMGRRSRPSATLKTGSPKGGTGNTAANPTATIRPIGRFGGAEGQQVLPLLLGAGVAALIVGPGLGVWIRRKNKKGPKLPRRTGDVMTSIDVAPDRLDPESSLPVVSASETPGPPEVDQRPTSGERDSAGEEARRSDRRGHRSHDLRLGRRRVPRLLARHLRPGARSGPAHASRRIPS